MARLACIVFLNVGAVLVDASGANAFLKSKPDHKRISEEYIQTNILAEVEATFGVGSATGKMKLLEAALAPMFAALPKNEHGYLGHATVRYALHRLFVQRHGWFIKGLYQAGLPRNSTSTAGLLKEQIPAYVQDLFEQRLGGRGFGLHELAVVAATIEHLVHKEALGLLALAFQVHDLTPTSVINETEVDDVLDTYMTAYIRGDDLSIMTSAEALELKQDIPEEILTWNATQEFVRAVRQNVSRTDSSPEQAASDGFDFSIVARVAERVGERFGVFQNHECQQIKALLVAREEGLTGRVRLANFWNPALEGSWRFTETLPYLTQLGVLDESNPANPRVMIANYINSASNCIGESEFYSVCCMDECEVLLSTLEKQIAAPEASAKRIAQLVSILPSSSVDAPRILSKTLLERLEEIADGPGGIVQLHGRLFAQWMHHAFPRECPYPHVSGSTSPLTPDEWMEATGEDPALSEEETEIAMKNISMSDNDQVEIEALLWSPEEELLIDRPVHMRALSSTVRNVGLCAVMVAVMFRLLSAAAVASHAKGSASLEKLLV